MEQLKEEDILSLWIKSKWSITRHLFSLHKNCDNREKCEKLNALFHFAHYLSEEFKMNTKLAISRMRTGQWAAIIKDCEGVV